MLSHSPNLNLSLRPSAHADKKPGPLTKRQIITLALTTVGIAIVGIYCYNKYYRGNNKDHKKKQTSEYVDRQSLTQKTKQVLSNVANVANVVKKEEEIEPEPYELEWSDIKDSILTVFEELSENNIAKTDVKILVVDNGLSKLPIHMYQEGYHNVTVCDTSSSALNDMKSKYLEQHQGINWVSYNKDDVTDQKLQQLLSQSFHLIIHRDSSETFMGKTIKPENEELLAEKFKQFSKMLIEQIIQDENNEEYSIVGKYLFLSPRRKIPRIQDKSLNWNVRRVIAVGYDVNDTQYSKTPFLYCYVCTKLNHDNQNMVAGKNKHERQALQQNGSDNNIVISDISFEKTEDKTIITFVNNELENTNENKEKSDIIDFSKIKNEEIKPKSIDVRHLNITFAPTIVVENIENDILIKYSKYENIPSIKPGALSDQVPYYFMVHGIVVGIRKFAKNIVFYDVKLIKDKDNEDAVTIQCIAGKQYINSLNNPKLTEEYKTNFLTQVNDEIKVIGFLGLSQKRVLSIFSHYTALIQ